MGPAGPGRGGAPVGLVMREGAFLAVPLWDTQSQQWVPVEYDAQGNREPSSWYPGFNPSTLRRPTFDVGERVLIRCSGFGQSSKSEGRVIQASLMGGFVSGYTTVERAIIERYFVPPKYQVKTVGGEVVVVAWESQLERAN